MLQDSKRMGWEVDGIEATVKELRRRGVVFEEYDLPGLKTVDGIAAIAVLAAAIAGVLLLSALYA